MIMFSPSFLPKNPLQPLNQGVFMSVLLNMASFNSMIPLRLLYYCLLCSYLSVVWISKTARKITATETTWLNVDTCTSTTVCNEGVRSKGRVCVWMQAAVYKRLDCELNSGFISVFASRVNTCFLRREISKPVKKVPPLLCVSTPGGWHKWVFSVGAHVHREADVRLTWLITLCQELRKPAS